MLKTERLELVALSSRHLVQTQKWANDPALQRMVLRYRPVTELDQQRWYERLCGDETRVVFAVECAGTGVHLGNTGLYHIDTVHRRGEFWIILGDEAARGCGYGHEVIAAMLGYAFNSLNLNRVYLHVASDNLSALKVYRASGFREEGKLHQHCFIAGCYVDVVVMSILRKGYLRGAVE